MLMIREEQMAVFEQAAVSNFASRVYEHLQTFFPEHCQNLQADQVRAVIRFGLERAEHYQLVSERDVYLYVSLMFLLGSYFDEDPQLPWVTEWLKEQAPETANTRMAPVYDQAMTLLDSMIGPENEYLRQTLGMLQQSQVFESLPDAPSFGHRLLLLLQALAPQKYQVLGDSILRDLVRHGYGAAKQHGLTTERGAMIYLSLAFLLGSGFDRDLLYPWAAEVLANPALADPAQKGEALYAAARKHLAKCPPGCSRRADLTEALEMRPAKPYRRIVEEPD
ncbi:MAG TPA: hypothetical protein PLD30_12810 [Candidatus Competibacteraceae bacterium]|nr:hypothetical protein [Candidatus Competibacteraceae bacterium]